jgi:hypothetical protein
MDYWLGALPPADEEAVEAHLRSWEAAATYGADLAPEPRSLPRLDDCRLGISEANVRVICHRAIRQLRACMGQPMERRSSAPWRPTTTCSWRGLLPT